MSLLPPVLLIEDDASDRELLSLVLKGAFGAVQLEVAGSAAEFARVMSAGQFGLVLTEHDLPWIRAGDVVRLMRDLKPGCPVVIVTSQPQEKAASELLHLGPDGLVPKTSAGYAGLPNVIRSALFRARRRAAVASRDAPYRHLVDDLPIGLFMASREGTILEANPALAGLLGFEGPEDLARRPLEKLFASRQEVESWFTQLESSSGVLVTQPQLRRADGGTLWVRLLTWTAPDRVAGGRQIQGVVQDISETRTSQLELAARTEALARSNEELKQMAYVVSHDLRQPLTQVIRYLDLLGEETGELLEEEARTFFDHARRGAANLERMVEGVLGLARIETQGGVFAPVDLDLVLARALEGLAEVQEAVEAEVISDSISLPTVIADESQMEQLFQNLLSNAFKFRGTDPPRVFVGVEEMAEHWHLWFQDSGIGIDPKHAERIFGMFQRLHTESEYPGSGIGLAVCRRIVARHGGRIWVDSQGERGATFHLTLAKQTAAQDADREES